MITATFMVNTELLDISLKVEGHAGQAEIGKDIVCASASILAYTLAQIVKSNEDRYDGEPTIRLESGDMEVTCRCSDLRTFSRIANAWRYTQIGFQLLAHNYPQYVQIIDG